jgi:D-alanine-D-alanine ligase-like ATP-grasp enzyme
MMIDQLFQLTQSDLKRKYSQQSSDMIVSTIENCRHLKHQDGCFELFGFDFLLDNDGRLYLLEINLNPSCSAERHAQLQEES